MDSNIDYGLLYESIMQNVLDSEYLSLEDLSDFSMSDNTELVTEAYVGKTKECLQLESEFSKLKIASLPNDFMVRGVDNKSLTLASAFFSTSYLFKLNFSILCLEVC